MPPLLTLPAVARAVVDLSETAGAQGVTARALANELHVSVGALYNYAGSMQNAVAAGEDILNEQLISRIANLPPGPAVLESLLEWAAANPGFASLYFDPSRPHAAAPVSLCNALEISAGDDPQRSFEAFRSWVGLTIRSEGPEAELGALIDAARSLLPVYAAARQDALAEAASPAPDVHVSDGEFAAVLESQSAMNATNDRAASVRFHSAQILIDRGSEGWNFRALSKSAGVALAALHAMGSRDVHLQQAGVDLAGSVFELSAHQDTEVPFWQYVAFMIDKKLQPGFHDASSAYTGATAGSVLERLEQMECNPDWCSAAVIGMTFATFFSADHRRAQDPQPAALAPRIAANFVRRVAGEV